MEAKGRNPIGSPFPQIISAALLDLKLAPKNPVGVGDTWPATNAYRSANRSAVVGGREEYYEISASGKSGLENRVIFVGERSRAGSPWVSDEAAPFSVRNGSTCAKIVAASDNQIQPLELAPRNRLLVNREVRTNTGGNKTSEMLSRKHLFIRNS